MPLYNPYNSYNSYNSNVYLQDMKAMRERLDKTIKNYEQNPNPYMQPQQAPITQNFQIAPQNNNPNDLQSSYVNNIDEVKNIFMTKNGIFVNKDFTSLWFKDTEGKIRTFALTEVVEKDEKDIEIDNLKKQVEDMKVLIAQQNQRFTEPIIKEEYNEQPKTVKKTVKKKEA